MNWPGTGPRSGSWPGLFPSVQIREAQAADYADARLIVITAGAKQKPGETRLHLLQRNVKIIHDIIDDIALQKSPAVVLIVSNPVDILTYVAHQRSGWSRGRIIGSGTVLDSARFRHLKHSAYHIIDYKGATWFAVGLALTRIAAAILRNQHGVLTVSSVLEGEYGLSGLSLGVPCILSRSGVEKVLQVTLPPDEQSALVKSAAVLREAIEQLGLAVAS